MSKTDLDLGDRIDMATDWLWIGAVGTVFRIILALHRPRSQRD